MAGFTVCKQRGSAAKIMRYAAKPKSISNALIITTWASLDWKRSKTAHWLTKTCRAKAGKAEMMQVYIWQPDKVGRAKWECLTASYSVSVRSGRLHCSRALWPSCWPIVHWGEYCGSRHCTAECHVCQLDYDTPVLAKPFTACPSGQWRISTYSNFKNKK